MPLGRFLAAIVSFAAVEGARVAAPAGRGMLLEDWVSALAPLVENDDHYYGGGGPRAGRNFLTWFDAARRQDDE